MVKKCGVCKIEKSSKEFGKRRDNRKHILKWACKDCVKKLGRERYRKLAKDKEWRLRLNVHRRELWHKKYKEDPEKFLRRCRKWRKNNPEKLKILQKKSRIKRRMTVLFAYGGKNPKCKCCKVKDLDFLAIDHISGGGNKHQERLRKEGKSFYSELIKNNFPKGYQIMCHNCNYKKYLRGKCSH